MHLSQYDTYANPNVAQRASFPFVVVLQSDQLRHHSTRLVMPLARLPRRPANAPRRLALTVNIGGEALYLAAHLSAAIPAGLLKAPVTSLKHEAGVFLDALDAVVSGV